MATPCLLWIRRSPQGANTANEILLWSCCSRLSGMLEIEGIGSEVVTAFLVVAASLTVLSILVSAWRLTGRRPLFYDLFLVEIHSWDARRFVQVLQLGQEFRPRGSWGDVMTRMRTRARTHSQTNGESDSGAPRHRISDTNVVIQSPATVMDDSSASVPSPSASTLWEIEMPSTGSNGGDISHESHFAAAAAIAVLGRGGLQVGSTSSGTMDVVPGTSGGTSLGVSAVGVSSIGGELNSNDFRVEGQRPQGITNIVMPMNISVVNDELDPTEVCRKSDTCFAKNRNAFRAFQSEAQVPSVENNSSSDEDAPASTSTEAWKAEESPIVEVPPQVENPVEVEGDSVIRLKFLDDTQRDARTTMTDTIGKFKSVHFGDAVAAGRVVRLIYQGQLLREDSRTLASYGLRDGCVVHCHISNTPYSTQGPSTSQPVTTATQLRHRDTTRATTATTPNNRQEANEFRYPRWAVALLLYTYRFPIIGLPLDAIVRFLFDRQAEDNTQPGVVRRAYRRLLSAIYREGNADETSPLDRAADAAARVPPQRLCLGDYLLWIFAGQFVAVWGFVYAFPQLCDHTALGLLVLLTLYFFFVVCRSRDQLAEPRPVDRPVGVSASPDR
ncbi:hypothetical protein Y032_0005g2541 [Ancylostoma ceylanicum]|nr:hypothetical protein Y032_0005g2541 [Ancylostoma ceylanicum]